MELQLSEFEILALISLEGSGMNLIQTNMGHVYFPPELPGSFYFSQQYE